jgi:hypothetical protein
MKFLSYKLNEMLARLAMWETVKIKSGFFINIMFFNVLIYTKKVCAFYNNQVDK